MNEDKIKETSEIILNKIAFIMRESCESISSHDSKKVLLLVAASICGATHSTLSNEIVEHQRESFKKDFTNLIVTTINTKV